MGRWLVVMVVMMLALPAQAERVEVTLGDRSYLADLPAQSRGAPMILALHGGGGNPAQFARASGLSGPAVAAGYAVIYPAGTGRRLLTWNGGYCCGPAARSGVDDMAFLEQVIADAAQRFGLDAGRVYVTGMSNGSILAEGFAARHPTQVKAVAGVAGTLDLSRYPPLAAVPLLHIHGTADSQVPYDGGQGATGMTDTAFTAVTDVIAAFHQVNGPMQRKRGLIDPVEDGTSVVVETWSAGPRPMIRLVTVRNGGHVWPGGKRARRQPLATQDISATEEILRFFAKHP